MQVKSILQYFRPALSNYLSYKTFILSILSGRLRQLWLYKANTVDQDETSMDLQSLQISAIVVIYTDKVNIYFFLKYKQILTIFLISFSSLKETLADLWCCSPSDQLSSIDVWEAPDVWCLTGILEWFTPGFGEGLMPGVAGEDLTLSGVGILVCIVLMDSEMFF